VARWRAASSAKVYRLPVTIASSEVRSEVGPASTPRQSKGIRRVVRSPRRLVLLGIAVACAAFVVATSVLFVWPPTDRPTHVDGILSLDGVDESGREAKAISLAEQGFASTLLFSQGTYRSTSCPKVPRIVVVCFEPNPGRTVGEVEFAARYARSHGWHSIAIVPGMAQSVRARLLMERCFPGKIVDVPSSGPLGQLPYQIVYEWGALTRALLVNRHC
jgi:hypothetical protein